MIDVLANEPHYAAHVQPIADAFGVTPRRRTHLLPPGPPTLVASFRDARLAKSRQVIYMEHGTGQTYAQGNPAYAGGQGKNHVALFLNPNERVADLNRAAYPNSENAVIGCPMLDRWVGHKPSNPEPVVALLWHWEALGVAPEARSAFRHYADVIPSLPYKLLGHGHPRAMKRLTPFYEKHGIEWTDSLDEVMKRADVAVFDNTSAGFMFAATGRPVVVLDAPWYRKAWGGRFWDWADVGIRTTEPAKLADAIALALEEHPFDVARREQIVEQIYPHRGEATKRAVSAINGWLGASLRAAA